MVAVDWSGDAQLARSRIWLAEACEPQRLARLESGRSRADLIRHLTTLPEETVAIGLDFAFSFPAWFLSSINIHSVRELWVYVAQYGEAWLAACEAPFWGRRGRARPALVAGQPALRRTELAVPRQAGIGPKSVFQIGGAGAVGTGSIRGMPLLHELAQGGAAVWPFFGGGAPVVVEIYPRLLTGAVHKSNRDARAALLAERYPRLAPEHRDLATGSEDAFDAAVSALVMVEHVDELAALDVDADPQLRVEGRIWHPGWRGDPL